MPGRCARVIACSGKVYYELAAHRREHKLDHVAIIRLEQQYPFPHDAFKEALAPFVNMKELVWCQEEPQNQGAWYRLRAYFRNDMPGRAVLAYAGTAGERVTGSRLPVEAQRAAEAAGRRRVRRQPRRWRDARPDLMGRRTCESK